MISFRAPRSVKSRVLGLNVGDIKARKWYLVVILLLYIGLITSFCLNISLLLRTYPKQNESSQTTTTLKSKGDFRYFYLPSLILWANILNNNSHLHFFEAEKMKNVTMQNLQPTQNILLSFNKKMLCQSWLEDTKVESNFLEILFLQEFFKQQTVRGRGGPGRVKPLSSLLKENMSTLQLAWWKVSIIIMLT